MFSFLVMLHLELWKQHSLIDVDNFKLFHLPLMALFTQTALLSYLIFPLVIWLLFIAEFCPMCQHFSGTQVPEVAFSIYRTAQSQQHAAQRSHLPSALLYDALHLSAGQNQAVLFYKPESSSLLTLISMLGPFQQLPQIIFPNMFPCMARVPGRSC